MEENYDEIATIMFSSIENKYDTKQIINEYIKRFNIVYTLENKTLQATLKFIDADVKLNENLITNSYRNNINEKILTFEEIVLQEAVGYIEGTIDDIINDYNDNFDDKISLTQEELYDIVVTLIVENRLMSKSRENLYTLFTELNKVNYLAYKADKYK